MWYLQSVQAGWSRIADVTCSFMHNQLWSTTYVAQAQRDAQNWCICARYSRFAWKLACCVSCNRSCNPDVVPISNKCVGLGLSYTENTRQEMSEDVQLFREEGINIGLRLNGTKYKVIAHYHLQPSVSLAGFSVVSLENASLLCAPTGPDDALDNALEVKCSYLRTAISRQKSITAHDTLILLWSSLSASRLMQILWCAPCVNHPFLLTHD